MKKHHQLQVNSLMKRIQRDRDEQILHRQTDSKIMIQRNKNTLADIIERQQVETKNTIAFLRYVLGRRAISVIPRHEQSTLSHTMTNSSILDSSP